MNSKTSIKNLTIIAMLNALAYLLMVWSRALPPLVPFPPLRYDPKDIIIIIGGFFYGPLTATGMSIVVSLTEMITVSDTGVIGMVMNVVSTYSFACTAAVIYKYGPKKKTLTGAVIGLVTGVIVMVATMMLWNYMITPLYTKAAREDVAAMLIPVFLPFNLLKGSLNAAATMLVYKPLSITLRKLHMFPESGDSSDKNKKSGKINIGIILASLFAVVTCVLLMLVFAKVI